MAEGRTQSATVRRYLEAIEANRPKRGRKRTPDSIKKRLADIEQSLASADKLTELKLRQERANLARELEVGASTVDISDLEREFVAVANSYGARQGITYQVWRETGVSAATLKKAGIGRGAGS
ncbi:MAG: hypothetical protein QOE63_1135 [Acidimicrobiaceae bacterium]